LHRFIKGNFVKFTNFGRDLFKPRMRRQLFARSCSFACLLRRLFSLRAFFY